MWSFVALHSRGCYFLEGVIIQCLQCTDMKIGGIWYNNYYSYVHITIDHKQGIQVTPSIIAIHMDISAIVGQA